MVLGLEGILGVCYRGLYAKEVPGGLKGVSKVTKGNEKILGVKHRRAVKGPLGIAKI